MSAIYIYVVTVWNGEERRIMGASTTPQGADQIIYLDRMKSDPPRDTYHYNVVETQLEG